jgi:predicted nucleotidyltransferase
MEVGLNNHLKKISSELFIKKGSIERYRIEKSLDIIVGKLEEYFGDEVSEINVFGSYMRDTILPRNFDEHSDVDILVEFNTEDYDKLKPESYRNKLKRFADLKYPKTLSAKDHPSIVIELNHIKFDLVPSIFEEGWIYDSIEIPNKNGGWMETDPDKFRQQLTKANIKYNSIIKPIVRLLKYWNARHDYPYASYELEKNIADMNFGGYNLESGFFYAIKNLPTDDFSKWARVKVDRLKDNAQVAKGHIKRQEITEAKLILTNILPDY